MRSGSASPPAVARLHVDAPGDRSAAASASSVVAAAGAAASGGADLEASAAPATAPVGGCGGGGASAPAPAAASLAPPTSAAAAAATAGDGGGGAGGGGNNNNGGGDGGRGGGCGGGGGDCACAAATAAAAAAAAATPLAAVPGGVAPCWLTAAPSFPAAAAAATAAAAACFAATALAAPAAAATARGSTEMSRARRARRRASRRDDSVSSSAAFGSAAGTASTRATGRVSGAASGAGGGVDRATTDARSAYATDSSANKTQPKSRARRRGWRGGASCPAAAPSMRPSSPPRRARLDRGSMRVSRAAPIHRETSVMCTKTLSRLCSAFSRQFSVRTRFAHAMAGNVDATLAKVTAVLAVKAAVINLLTARARLKHSDHATGRPEPWKEARLVLRGCAPTHRFHVWNAGCQHTQGAPAPVPLGLRNLPSFSVDRASGGAHACAQPEARNSLLLWPAHLSLTLLPLAFFFFQNCMENEPYFLALALAASRVNDPAATSKLLTVYCTARCVHSVVFLSGLPQPLRAMAYLTGLGAAILLAVSVLSA